MARATIIIDTESQEVTVEDTDGRKEFFAQVDGKGWTPLRENPAAHVAMALVSENEGRLTELFAMSHDELLGLQLTRLQTYLNGGEPCLNPMTT